MSLSLSFAFAGVQVNISPSASSAAKFNVCGVQHFDDGHIEAEVMNFSGKIIISPPSSKVEENFAEKNDVNGITSRDHIVAKSSEEEEPFVGEVVVDAIPEICPPADTPLDCNKNGINEAEQAHSSSSSSSLLNQLFQHVNTSREVVVDATPETQICPQVSACTSETEETSSASVLTDTHINTSSSSSNHNIIKESNLEPYVPPPPNQSLELLAGIDSDDERESNIEIPTPEAAIATGTAVTPTATATTGGGTRVCFDLSNTQIIQESPIHKPKLDLRLHELCASEDDEADVISDLRDLLRSDPELASIRDDFGDFPAHVFANNDSFIYASRDEDVRQFVLELYDACPAAFLTEGYDGQIPFAGAIVDWVDECHRVYSIPTPRSANSFSRGSSSSSSTNVVLLSEIKTLTKSTRVINSLCVREEVQRLVKLPSHVSLPIKAMYSFQMLSRILDELSSSAVRDLRPAQRREFWAVASKRRDKIIQCVARLPFLIRTILLIENKNERDAVLSLSVVRNALFRPESVDLWLVALLSGGERARNCAVTYLKLISQLCLTELFGRKHEWSNADIQRFHSMRKELYDEVAKLAGFLPCMLHLGDGLYDVATRRAVKYVVETRVGRAFPVYMTFMELFLLLTLMTSYRIIVELVYAIPSEEFLSQYREFWGLALTIAVYFGIRDLFILISLFFTEEKLACRYASNFGNLVGYATTASVIPMLSILYVNSNIEGRNYAGIVSGLLWWKVLLHMKGMSESLSTLVYTIIQITGTMKYFLFIFLGTIFFFADMVDIIKKTSGECEDFDGQEDSSLEVFCSLTPLETYLAMYGVMIGGFDVGTLEGSSALVCLLLVAASVSVSHHVVAYFFVVYH
mmetsp:Transcript_38226/g.80420  ORF Transcript_38226/g.80420 Transcript_38226/m.80420 type:complete len:864 (+) Transcript_38226:37-2628(+)